MFVQSICHRTHITYYFSPPFLFYFSRYGFRNGAYFTTLVKIEFEFNRGGIFLISESCYFISTITNTARFPVLWGGYL